MAAISHDNAFNDVEGWLSYQCFITRIHTYKHIFTWLHCVCIWKMETDVFFFAKKLKTKRIEKHEDVASCRWMEKLRKQNQMSNNIGGLILK